MSFIKDLGEQVGAQAASGLFGLAFAGVNDRRQLKQQEKLNNLQIRGNKELADYNFMKQLDMWKATNYSAQMAELKQAGLNPGLLYGMGGAGGATTGGGGGSVAGAAAPQGGGEIGMSLQLGLMAAQKRVLETQADKNEAEATKTAGVDTTQTGLQNKILEVQGEVAARTKEKTIEGIETAVAKSYKELSLLTYQDTVEGDEEVLNARIKGTAAGYLQAILQNTQIKAQTNLTDEQAKQVAASIVQKWTELGQGEKRLAIEAFKAEIEANRPGIWNVIGGQAQELIEEVYDLTGVRRKKQQIKK